jgi:hypothetical protein
MNDNFLQCDTVDTPFLGALVLLVRGISIYHGDICSSDKQSHSLRSCKVGGAWPDFDIQSHDFPIFEPLLAPVEKDRVFWC